MIAESGGAVDRAAGRLEPRGNNTTTNTTNTTANNDINTSNLL